MTGKSINKMNIFEEQGLNANLLKAIDELGYREPTEIQVKTIPHILNNTEDLIGLAQTGTGKTAGFGLPILNLLDIENKNTQAIILSPTRELAIQISKDLKSYSKYIDNINIVAVYGGAAIEKQISGLRKGAQIVVGTPGRTLDLIKRKALKINHIKWLVLDEADEMLNMGFREDLDSILENTPQEKRTLLFSATMPDGVRRISNSYLKNPVELSAGKKNIGAENVKHQYYVVKASNRYLALKRLADFYPNIYGIVFCRTRAETKDIASKLIDDGYNADALHGDLSQAQRDYVMNRFRAKQLQLLIATDVAARGLDINDLTHVINYNLPDDPEVYIHRSGRTGRAGKKGISVVISHSREMRRIKELERIVGKKFEKQLIPSGSAICEKQLYTLIDKIENTIVDETQINPYMEAVEKKLSWLDRDELLKRFIYVEFNSFLKYYEKAKDLNVSANSSDYESDGKSRRERRRTNSKEYSRFFINVGQKQNLKAANLIGLINEATNSNNLSIGKIDIQRNFSFFEVEKNAENIILSSFDDINYGSVKLDVQISNKKERSDDNYKSDRRGGYKSDRRKRSYGHRGDQSKSSNRNSRDRKRKSYK